MSENHGWARINSMNSVPVPNLVYARVSVLQSPDLAVAISWHRFVTGWRQSMYPQQRKARAVIGAKAGVAIKIDEREFCSVGLPKTIRLEEIIDSEEADLAFWSEHAAEAEMRSRFGRVEPRVVFLGDRSAAAARIEISFERPGFVLALRKQLVCSRH